MSQITPYNIKCPKCEHDFEVELYDAINVREHPECRDLLMRNQLNLVTCEQCESSFRVDKPLLYNDPARSSLIYWFPGMSHNMGPDKEAFQRSIHEMTRLLPEDVVAPEVHLVMDRTELVERIFILEKGLDARIIEYIKHTIFLKNPEKMPPSKKNLLFNAEDSTDEMLFFVLQDLATLRLEGILEYSREAYVAMCEMFDRDDNTPTLLELFPGPYFSARSLLLEEELKQNSEG